MTDMARAVFNDLRLWGLNTFDKLNDRHDFAAPPFARPSANHRAVNCSVVLLRSLLPPVDLFATRVNCY